uniref:HRDC domain-containing protein n=1 Tax=Acrobeloides nanus TaxID=290746 RepID=A0A914D0P3_9BILA
MHFVKTVDDLKQLIQILNESKEFAVDLEVFHGGESDIEWLQRDFGIYVVNMFDTFEALNMLGMHPKSLKYLVQQFCGVELNKEFQRADWRLRPLTEDHIVYARSDTRYLLSCYDGIQNRLLDEGNEYKNLLMTTYEKSVRICLRTFQQPRFDPNGYLSLLKGRRAINNRQSYALKELWKWRDATAREEDESLDYVLPSHMMLQIAEILPKEQNGIFACCAPIPLMVKRDVKFLHSIIRIALDLPLEKTNTSVSVEELMNATRVAQIADNENKITKLKAKLRPRIDFSTFRVDEQVPPLNSRLKINQRPIKEKPGFELPIVMDVKKQQGEAFIRIDDETEEKNELDKRIKKILKKINEWATPFDCYLVAMKEAEKEENGPKKDDEAKADTEAVLFSHHDEANVRIMNTTNGPVTSASQSTTVHAQATLLEDELNQSFPGLKLTKKQKQRLHKQTDINVRSNQGQNRRGLKRGHEHFSPSTSHETSTDVTNSSPMNLTGNPVVDYSSYDPQMFY